MDQQSRNDENVTEITSDSAETATPSAESDKAAPNQKAKAMKETVEWIKALAIAVVLVVIIRSFLFAPFMVEGESMHPNFETGERLIVNKILYKFREPDRGEVVVFHVPEQGRDFIKRVIGLPGDTIKVQGDDVFINDVKLEEPYIAEAIKQAQANGQLYNNESDFPNERITEATVPEDTIFAMGDNRSNSQDSRALGYISNKELVGRAEVIFWPLNKLSFIKH
ncbi:signal peptidase I [Paenibacillus algorifonticola]|uniref:signal peptidase I n=1 Tax=Paenibacillus algorifonticola TaxID=684063 RepID=UPI003D2A8672